MARTVAIVQARMGSTRLPGKVLAPLAGKPMLRQILERVDAAGLDGGLVLATTDLAEDDALETEVRAWGYPVHRGPAQDVLERYHGAALACGAELIVRITADDPFKDPGLIRMAARNLAYGPWDYVSNSLTPSWPEGLDVEAFTMEALDRARNDAVKPFEREHVTPHIWQNPEKFRLKRLLSEVDYSWMRLTVDYPSDLEFAREIYGELYPANPRFSFADIMRLFERKPALLDRMPRIERNQGLRISMEKENA
jgi:spore coat polysaccharide biosynthesis protein SpsF